MTQTPNQNRSDFTSFALPPDKERRKLGVRAREHFQVPWSAVGEVSEVYSGSKAGAAQRITPDLMGPLKFPPWNSMGFARGDAKTRANWLPERSKPSSQHCAA